MSHESDRELDRDYGTDKPKYDISDIASPDAPRIVNEKGASQSDIKTRFDLIDANAMFAMAKVLDYGAKKYGEDNWRQISTKDHLNHLLMHTYAYLAGNDTDEHLSHILCRATFAIGVSLQNTQSEGELTPQEYLDNAIRHWRTIYRDTDVGETKEMARHYIDAFQSVRVSLLGELLSKED